MNLFSNVKSDYKGAQNGNSKVRQEFLDAIVLGEAGEFIKELEYSRTPILKESVYFKGIIKVVSEGSMTFQEEKSKVIVFSNAFEKNSFHYFLSSLIDHEGQHARQYGQGIMDSQYNFVAEQHSIRTPRDLLIDYSQSLLELSAYANQLVSERYKDFLNSEREKVKGNLNYHSFLARLLARRIHPLNSLKKDLGNILCDSPGDDWVRENILSK